MAQLDLEPRKISIVTTTRADYGLLNYLMREVLLDDALELSVLVSGTHLSPAFGMTVEAIEADGFPVSKRLEILLSADTDTAVLKSMGLGLINVSHALQELEPDILVVLGDRFEIIPFALSAFVLGIPLAHIHGGETSQGALDEGFRHAVTKLASIHFPAAEAYRRRIVQMGEDPDCVFNFGAPGLDAIYHLKLLTRKELEEELGFDLDSPVAIVTYHPVTTERGTAMAHLESLLTALNESQIRVVFTKANADTGGGLINERLAAFCRNNPDRFKLFDSLGQLKYLSCLKHLDVMIGNSSSGLLEAPSFNLPVVNIGERQKGRIRGFNVIDVGNTVDDIEKGIARALSPDFQKEMLELENPYDRYRDGKTSYRIKETLKAIELSRQLLKKSFRDLDWESIRGTHAFSS